MNFEMITPRTTGELLQALANNQGSRVRIGAGYTDLILELKGLKCEETPLVINLADLTDPKFTHIEKTDAGIRLGALVTAGKVIIDASIQTELPVLCKAASELGSRQLRHRATLGGNLCTASPAGDIAAALVALEARCEILSADGTLRTLALTDFLVGVRKTALRQDEVLQSVFIPTRKSINKHLLSDFLKVGTRRSMEIAVVSLAYQFELDAEEIIRHAGIAIGSVAPTVKFVSAAGEFLVGKKFSSIGAVAADKFAAMVCAEATPISDIRASAWYRREVLYNISRGIFDK